MILGSIEAGGTKFVCAVGDENGKIIERAEFPTTSPEETMNMVVDFFKGKNIEAMGIGCFGPISLNKKMLIMVALQLHQNFFGKTTTLLKK